MTATLTKELAAFHASAIRSVMQDTGGYNSRALQSAAEDMEMFASGALVSVPAAELEALRKDAERLNAMDKLAKKHPIGYTGWKFQEPEAWQEAGLILSMGAPTKIRVAIDAATKAKP